MNKSFFLSLVLGLAVLPSALLQAQESDEVRPASPVQSRKYFFIGHRFYEAKSGGWGWVKKPGESWDRAQWVALQENPQTDVVSPSRKLDDKKEDHNAEYKLYGHFASYSVYDPQRDELDAVFVLESPAELMGTATPLRRSPGPIGRHASKKSRSSSRQSAIDAGPDRDSF